MGPRDGSIRGSKAGFLLSLAHNTDWAERRNDLIKDALVLCREAVTAPEPYYHFQTWRETLSWIDELAEGYPQEWREQAWREYDQTFDELKLNPQAVSSWAGALVRLGSYWVEIGKNGQAIELFREALAKLRHLTTLGPATPRVHIKAAQNLEAIVLFLDDEEDPIIELALQHYQQAIELDPEDPFAYIQTAQCWERLSRIRKDITILDQAIATYRKGLEHGIVDYQFFVDFGRIRYKRVAESQEVPNRQELLQQAIDVFMRALILNFDCDLAPYNILARCFAELGKIQRALKTLNLGLMLFWRVADFRKYHEHPMWARLRQHPDFLELIAGYEARDITRYSQWEKRYEKMLDKLRLQINQLTERTIANEALEETLDAFAKLATSYPSRLQLADALLEYLPLAEPGKRDSLASQALELYTQLSVEDPHLLPNPWIGAIRVCRLTGQKETADQMDRRFRKIFAEEVDFSFVDKLLDEAL
ncbi:MAG: hypothetical protein D6820_13360 [Lentisphaerae bacterium]|nr:MAG: hypothetical protein D6820_13360 [Lentisphaerota bacterium]